MPESWRQLFKQPLSLAPIWIILPIVGAGIAATLSPIPPHDYWWHLVSGRFFDATGTIPSTNQFLYTLPADAPFYNQPWLGQWVMYLLHDHFGPSGNVLLRNILLLGTWVTVLGVLMRRTREPRVAGVLGLVAVVGTIPIVSVRTRMFGLIPFVLLLSWITSELEEAPQRTRRRLMVATTFGVIFWANTHGAFVLAPILTWIAGVGVCAQGLIESRRLDAKQALRWGGFGLLLVGASCMNPQGPAIFLYVLKLAVTSDVSSTVTEWLPPSFDEGMAYYMLPVLLGAILILARERRHVHLAEVLLFLGTTFLAASAVRNLFWWSITTVLIVAPHVARTLEGSLGPISATKQQGRMHTLVLLILVGSLVAIQPGLLQGLAMQSMEGHSRRGETGSVLSIDNSMASLNWIPKDSVVFHDQAIGGLVEYHRTTGDKPVPVAYVDQRMELIPADVWGKYFAISQAASGWEKGLEEYKTTHLILNLQKQWPLVQAALASSNWRLLGLDDAHAVFVRETSPGPTQ